MGQDLHDLIAAFARFGATDDGGVCRLTGTAEDKAVRDLFAAEIGKRGLKLDIDGIGNMFATAMLNHAASDAVLVGSHLDSQPTGGRYDGVYGVLAGLLAAEAIMVRARSAYRSTKGSRRDPWAAPAAPAAPAAWAAPSGITVSTSSRALRATRPTVLGWDEPTPAGATLQGCRTGGPAGARPPGGGA